MPKKREENIGKTINSWTIIGLHEKRGFYVVQCKCGFQKKAIITNLNVHKHCMQCTLKEREEQIIGKKINNWTIIRKTENKSFKDFLYVVRCHCGKEVLRRINRLKYSIECNNCAQKRTKEKRHKTLKLFYYKKALENKGKIKGNFKILDIIFQEKEKGYKYKVKCLFCNKKKEIRNTKFNITESCGCLRNERVRIKNLKISDSEQQALIEMYKAKTYSRKELCEMFGITENNFYIYYRKYKQNQV